MKKKKWLAVYTKPRREKKIDRMLTDGGMESYCPLNKVRRKWTDRVKLVDEPLFKSYVFVHVNQEEEQQVREVSGVLNFVYWLGKPAVIRQGEIDRIKKFLNDYIDVSAEPLSINTNDAVIITSGALMDKKGKVLRKLGNKVELEIESLGYKLVANVESKNLLVVKNNISSASYQKKSSDLLLNRSQKE
ncbi:MAG: UpxY family transcription antiterminator [Bacteroidota bacterium]